MHSTVKNLLDIKNNIKIHLNKLNINNNPKIVAVSKTFKIDKILPLIEYGHSDYGENKVQEALEKLASDRTTFIVAHRLSTITHADRIVLIEDGEIKEVGSHDELMRLRGGYYNLYQVQQLDDTPTEYMGT